MEVIEMLKEMDKDLDWLKENIESLEEKYDQKSVAIKNSEVIAVGKSTGEVIKKLKLKGIDPGNTLIQFISKIPIVL